MAEKPNNNSILAIEKFGSKVLRAPCAAISKIDKSIEKLADKMLKTMYKADGVGLAAPQVGVNKRLIVIDVDYSSERYEDDSNKDNTENEYNPLIMINPVIVYQEGEMKSYEGCLSFPGVFFNVKRAKRIVFKFLDLKGKEQRMEAEGDLFCRCIQHEIDHLDGKLFCDIATNKEEAKIELTKGGFANVDDQPPMFIL